jgi:zinc/manganese transport system substrate-binding protein
VTTSPDLGNIAKVIGGDKISVISLYKGNQDPHVIEPRPSMVIAVKNADLLIVIGMDLDMWVNSLIEASKNSKVLKGASGYLDASAEINKLEVPSGKVDMSMGDVHIYGNPHYQTDPCNGKVMASEIYKKLCELMPESKDYFTKNYNDYIQKLDSAIQKWDEMMKPYQGLKIVVYHDSWVYFIEHFGLIQTGTIEPKPSIPPSASYIVSLVEKMKNEKIKIIIIEPYQDIEAAKKIAAMTGAKIVVFPQSVGGLPGEDSYINMFEINIQNFINALK